MGASQAKPEQYTEVCLHVGPPPVGGIIWLRCHVGQAVAKGGGLGHHPSKQMSLVQAFNWTIMTLQDNMSSVENEMYHFFPLISLSMLNNLSHFWMTDSILFGNALITLPRKTETINHSSETAADVFTPRHCINTHLNARPANCRNVCFYWGGLTCWLQINQIHLACSTWLLDSLLVPEL